MGSNYSSGPFPKDVLLFVNLDLAVIQAKIYRFQKSGEDHSDYNLFMTKRQFKHTFQLSDQLTFRLFHRFDREGYGRVPSLDVWAALALASNAEVIEKINFLFSLSDINRDRCLSAVDLEVLIICCTRGFSRLKGIKIPQRNTIKTLMNELLRRKNIYSPANGEIMLKELRNFLMTYDLSRTYLASLGTLILEKDSGKLINQRAELLKNLAIIEHELNLIQGSKAQNDLDHEIYQRERGGDATLLRIEDPSVMDHENTVQCK